MASNDNLSNSGNKQGGNQGGNQGGSRQSGDTSNRGFASMDPARQREIASEGGRAAHAAGTAHEFTSQEARAAGRMSHKNDGNQQSGDSGSASRSGGNSASGSRSGSSSGSGSRSGGNSAASQGGSGGRGGKR